MMSAFFFVFVYSISDSLELGTMVYTELYN